MATQAIPSFDSIRASIREHIETTTFDKMSPGDVADPDPNPAGEGEWDEGTDTTKKRNTDIQV